MYMGSFCKKYRYENYCIHSLHKLDTLYGHVMTKTMQVKLAVSPKMEEHIFNVCGIMLQIKWKTIPHCQNSSLFE